MIVFDLDGTLAPSKQPITEKMADLLSHLLQHYLVCVISGAELKRFRFQLLDRFKVETTWYQNIYLMPTNGTSFYRFDHGRWIEIYREKLPRPHRQEILATLMAGAEELGMLEKKTWGEIMEDRGSQITFSGLGQQAPLEEKLKWDPKGVKRQKLARYVMAKLPDFEVAVSGETSVDVTKKGIDKAYGMKKLRERLGISFSEMVFVGDALETGGNDYPVKALGINTVGVKDSKEAEAWLEKLLDTHDNH